ncbi:MAG: mechanosensitive ion channel [Campylobacterales bacterium]|nr:mechanosensitive ion channel [Campylobacterales bacterium]
MKNIIVILLFTVTFALSQEKSDEKQELWDVRNIWMKVYLNNKNYNTIIKNITVTERKLARRNNTLDTIEDLQQKLNLYKSKLSFYKKDSNFDVILRHYKYTVGEISIYDFLFKESLKDVEKLLQKYSRLKKDFYLAKSKLTDYYNQEKKKKNKKTLQSIQEDLEYFIEYGDNIEKVHHDLLDTKEEVVNKYKEYKDEVFTQHLMTLTILFVVYIVYRFICLIVSYFSKRSKQPDNYKSFRKILSSLFVTFAMMFLAIRYIDDIAYMLTLLGVVAAALTLAAREIIMSIAGGIYLFFSHMIRVGDRIMVQYGNRHTIGDVVDVTMFQIKLHEVEDYNSLKDVKNLGRTVYIPNSYLFTNVFYNYSLKKHGMIKDLLELEFKPESDFDKIEKITNVVLNEMGIEHSISFTLNALKTGIIAKISYQTNYKDASKNRGKLAIRLLKEFSNYDDIQIKQAK